NKIINNVNLNYIIKLMNDLDKRINIRNYKKIKSKIDKRFTKNINKLKNKIRYLTKKYSKNHSKVKQLKINLDNELIKYNKLKELYEYIEQITKINKEYNENIKIIENNYNFIQNEYNKIYNDKLDFGEKIELVKKRINYLKRLQKSDRNLKLIYGKNQLIVTRENMDKITVFVKDIITLKPRDKVLSYEYKLEHKLK